MTDPRCSVDEAIAAIAAGEMVVVLDDHDRENEADLIVAAQRIQSEQMAFMVRHTSGIICAPIPAETAERLDLAPMVGRNDAPMGTAFTVSVDYREGLTTGISAEERTHTVRALANPNVGAAAFVRPGHVFPLIAREGGVLMRSGHTEAAVDLAQLAGLPPVGVIGELVNDDGTVKHGEQVYAFAAEHGFKCLSVADLIAYRLQRERMVERRGAFALDTPAGPARAIAYTSRFEQAEHLAVVIGPADQRDPVLVRLHRENLVEDIFGRRRALESSLSAIAEEGAGVVVYLRDETIGGRPATPGEAAGLDHGAREDTAESGVEQHDSRRARDDQWREIGIGAQILRDLGFTRVALLATRKRQYVGLSGYGIEIVDTRYLS